MAYDEALAKRIRKVVAAKRGIQEKPMFGGLSFLLKGRMFCGILKEDLVVRVAPEEGEKLLQKAHVRPMDFTGRPMKGFLYVAAQATKSDKNLAEWIGRSLEFVSSLPAKKSKKK